MSSFNFYGRGGKSHLEPSQYYDALNLMQAFGWIQEGTEPNVPPERMPEEWSGSYHPGEGIRISDSDAIKMRSALKKAIDVFELFCAHVPDSRRHSIDGTSTEINDKIRELWNRYVSEEFRRQELTEALDTAIERLNEESCNSLRTFVYDYDIDFLRQFRAMIEGGFAINDL